MAPSFRATAFACAAAALLFGAWVLSHIPGASRGDSGAVQPAKITVSFSWPEFHERIEVQSEAELAAFGSLLERTEVQAEDPGLDQAFWEMGISWSDGSVTTIHVTRAFQLFLTADDARALPRNAKALRPVGDGAVSGIAVRWVNPDLAQWVRARTGELEDRFFGELLTWPEVSRYFPVGGVASVRDLETGRTFRVRRHRGDAHADVEPLTAEDSRTLKEIYGGAWSWKRRAVVMTVADHKVAGSMNGMPHGWGDLFENDFVGHSCIHFWHSRVHGTWREDPGHQLQVIKAAGRLAETLDAATPDDLARWAVAAVNHQDVASLRYMAHAAVGENDFSILLSQLALPIRHITYHSARLVKEEDLSASVEVSATVYYREPDPDQGYSKVVAVRLTRSEPEAPWRVDLGSLMPLARFGGQGGVGAMSGVPFDAAAEALAMGCAAHGA